VVVVEGDTHWGEDVVEVQPNESSYFKYVWVLAAKGFFTSLGTFSTQPTNGNHYSSKSAERGTSR
jgi:hypothetical protein